MNRTQVNQKANRNLQKLFNKKEIYHCEIRLPGCLNTWMLNYCHRHKRKWYYDKPDELLWNFDQVVLGCSHCHEIIENDKELTKEIFSRERGEDNVM